MEQKYLIGIKNNKIVIAEIEITDRNGYQEFTASFNEGEAFNIDKVDDDYKKEYYTNFWDEIDSETKLKYLHDGDITFDDWVSDSIFYDDGYSTYIDCSCTDIETQLTNDIIINFETISCGQYDCRDDSDFKDMIFTNKKAFTILMGLWDNYHLKDITNNKQVLKDIETINELLKDYDPYTEKTSEFIKNNINIDLLDY